ncbi:MAG: hypothetical protein M1501_01215 [Candidatus Omnitrophica bacterium]|nr:hypothetical protein [Candidatus Omnitrophota bacterium]
MTSINQSEKFYSVNGGNLSLLLDKKTGSFCGLTVFANKEFVWTKDSGEVLICDDLVKKNYGRNDIEKVTTTFVSRNTLCLEKHFKNAQWYLVEEYTAEQDMISWNAQVVLKNRDFRSCSIKYLIPWAQPLYNMSFWSAREGMPSSPHRFAKISLEYGEVTSGILIPAVCYYRKDKDAGLLLAMPFDFQTPRLSFVSEYRAKYLEVRFDWLALKDKNPAKVSLIFKGTGGDWRPALGWLHDKYGEYFSPRSESIHKFWGGHISGNFHVSPADIKKMVSLGLKWYEIHAHFPAYGNYHPENISAWTSGHYRKNKMRISVDMIKNTIKTLHSANVFAMPYIQISGDGDVKHIASKYPESIVKDISNKPIYSEQYLVYQMNSDINLPFGKDVIRQVDGMIKRYPDMDGVFLDQACYNFADTAHNDGITAFNNSPCYMTGFNYFPHLERLSNLLHPEKAIIANGPFAIGIMKYIDGIMAEGSGWLCDQFQYYALEKPMFFLVYEADDRNIEMMFQNCLLYGAGFTSYPAAIASKNLYFKYVPVIKRFFRRRWIFEPEPFEIPPGYKGNIFISPNNNILMPILQSITGITSDTNKKRTIYVKTGICESTKRILLHTPGEKSREIRFSKRNGKVQFDIPAKVGAAVAELLVKNGEKENPDLLYT